MDGLTQPPSVTRDRANVIRSIDTIRPAVQENDYVDTRTLASVHKQSSELKQSAKNTSHKSKLHREVTDNITNERRECNSIHQQSNPPLPPRNTKLLKDTPPPLLPRKTQLAPPVVRPKHIPSRQPIITNDNIQGHFERPSEHLQPSVLIVEHVSNCGSSRRRNDLSFPALERLQPVTTQPTSSNNLKQVTTSVDKQTGVLTNSIICKYCGKCKCASCSDKRELPVLWLCDGNCKCSADSVVDIASCMCAVKELYKKGCKQDNQERPVHPCDCTPSVNCCIRWTGLSFLSLFLPCLCCYLPLKAGVTAVEACYSNCCHQNGCKCEIR